MARILALLSLYLMSTLMPGGGSVHGANVLTIWLIHRDSPDSSLHLKGLSISALDSLDSQKIRPQCIGNSCSYNISYRDNTSSAGILGQETFTFSSSTRGAESVARVVVGCGIGNKVTYDDNSNQIAGIMGLGWGRLSFVNQIDSQSNGKFSYCLPVVNKYTQQWPKTYPRFGSNTVIRPNLRVTPLQRNQHRVSYLLDLRGKSLNWKRLNNFTEMRDLKNRGQRGLDLCYERKMPEGFKKLPTITFHLQNGDLVVQPQGSFLVMDKIGLSKGEYFCLAMVPNASGTVIGAYQQTNLHFVYDSKGLKLFFGPEDCSRDG
ncbi:hypothetical protein U1Q18_034249 [Sarracenia purpurea var. burkii]